MVAGILQIHHSYSSVLGKSHFLLRKNVIRKEKEEKEAAEEEKKKELDSIITLKEQIERLNEKLITKEIVIEDFAKDQAILLDLYEHEIITRMEMSCNQVLLLELAALQNLNYKILIFVRILNLHWLSSKPIEFLIGLLSSNF